MNLQTAEIGKEYQVNNVTKLEGVRTHLHRLGIVKGNRITLTQRDNKSGIVSVQKTRIGLEMDILAAIEVEEVTAHSEWVALDQFKVGERGRVVSVYGQGAVRRRLMDMGVTKQVEVVIRKRAPLGDPIELTLRGYELTLRKAEAAMILMERIEEV